MPDFPIVDAHLHIWDHSRLNYSAFHGHPIFEKSFHVEDYREACGDVDVEAMVFLECYADFTPEGGLSEAMVARITPALDQLEGWLGVQRVRSVSAPTLRVA